MQKETGLSHGLLQCDYFWGFYEILFWKEKLEWSSWDTEDKEHALEKMCSHPCAVSIFLQYEFPLEWHEEKVNGIQKIETGYVQNSSAFLLCVASHG